MRPKRLIIITGSKGGTGKSLMARYIADKYESADIAATLVDADPDVTQLGQYYPNVKIVHPTDISAFLSIVQDAPTSTVLMDMPGRGLSDLLAANKEASIFEWLSEHRVSVVMINVITPYRASTSSVGTMLDVVGDATVTKWVLLNQKFGPNENDWVLWYGSESLDIPQSQSRKRLIAAGGKEIKIPEIRTSVPVLLDLTSETFSRALSPDGVSLKTAHMKQYLRTWLREMDKAFRPIQKDLGL